LEKRKTGSNLLKKKGTQGNFNLGGGEKGPAKRKSWAQVECCGLRGGGGGGNGRGNWGGVKGEHWTGDLR